ncbi:EpsG family protein [Aerococcus urinaeequi]|uniref:EpsG family protein n=1 Tax=Aerococcus urinaeequi TaxID=51665 RepID=UPI003D6A544A
MTNLFQYITILIILIIFFLLSILEQYISISLKKIIVFILLLLISLLASKRTIGTDTSNYELIFHYSPIINDFQYFLNNLFEYRIEPLFVLIISYLKQFGISVEGLFFISSYISLGLVSILAFKVSKKHQILIIYILCLFYLIRGPLDIIRQFLAMSFFLVALYYLSDNKIIKYYIVILIGITAHSSLIVALFLPLIVKKNWSVREYILTLISMYGLGIILINVLRILINNLETDLFFLDNLELYLNTTYYYDSLSHFMMRLIMEHFLPILGILLVVFSLSKKVFFYTDNFSKVLLNTMIIGSLFYSFFMGTGQSTLAIRLNYLLQIGNIIIIKNIISDLYFKDKLEPFIIFTFLGFIFNFIVVYYYSGVYRF